ncbi:hypothetical protein BSL82_03385 [Tardibacter chloracetimidivorans]|uniref:Terminase large subunit gp17-like C-terminal domain-containing protein n=1 Tax=Tardibacter chloracetimidivorans TaxID=1921510 RepID=A0A1L3ZS75_9SPHN|nr:hypothetical protein [Tardibacter chloracetimidivorans]API58460.1 hypothetical protein BSL82_03385 [Tardibacter chloracetimidivorans]
MDPKTLKVRKRLLEDFNYYAPVALQIRTKESEILPLKLNEAQKRLLEVIDTQLRTDGKVRIVILKGRQMGLSTAVGAWMYWWVSQRKAQKALVMTHKADSTAALFDMTKRFYDNTPVELKPQTKYSSKRELKFGVLDSGYMVATAGGDSVARGETINVAHLSELAFWPKSSANDILSGLLDAIPNSRGSAVFIESTANGVSGPFYEFWKGAEQGKNGYYPLFLPWFIDPGYREKVPTGFQRTPDEEALVERFGLDDAQLQFRRRKIAEKGLDLWNQEYPNTPEDAFLTSGRPVFNSHVLAKRLPDVPDIVDRMALVQTGGHYSDFHFEPDPRGELLLYKHIDPGEKYYIGADVADGTRSLGINKSDWSVAQILDSKKRQVAIWRSQVDPDYYSYVLYHLGMLFNEARLIVERNNHGILPNTRLGKDFNYPNLHTEVVYDKISDTETVKLGFQTNVQTKPLIIDQLRAEVREGVIQLNDKTTIEELMTFVVDDAGKMTAEAGCHDDCVMSLALANHIHEGAFDPVESTDEFYIEAL